MRRLSPVVVTFLLFVGLFASGPKAQLFNPPMWFPSAFGPCAGPSDVVSGAVLFYAHINYATSTCGAPLLVVENGASGVGNDSCDILSGTNGLAGVTASCGSMVHNGLTLAAFCATVGPKCAYNKAYNQATGGASINISGSTNGTLLINCFATNNPCSDSWTVLTRTAAGLGTNYTQPITFVAVTKISSSPPNDSIILSVTDQPGASRLGAEMYWDGSTANTITAHTDNGSGPTTCSFTASVNVWHVVQLVFNGSSSISNVDGVETSSLNCGTTGMLSSNHIAIGERPDGADGECRLCSWHLASAWPVGFTFAQRTSMCRLIQGKLGTSNFGATC